MTYHERGARLPNQRVGFIGLGVMGQPMALNLAAAGVPLAVWNRSMARTEPLRQTGASVMQNVVGVFSRARIVFLMLANEGAIDDVLCRSSSIFAELVAGRIVVSMGTTAPSYSKFLGADIHRAGGQFVECPVSGSRKTAESAQLVGLLGGDSHAVEEVRPLLQSMCRHIVDCGPVGHAMLMKLAINLHNNTMLAGLAEAVTSANRRSFDSNRFREAIDAGPLPCDLKRAKPPRFTGRNFDVQAATADVLYNCRLIAAAARDVGIATPLLDHSSGLYADSVNSRGGRLT